MLGRGASRGPGWEYKSLLQIWGLPPPATRPSCVSGELEAAAPAAGAHLPGFRLIRAGLVISPLKNVGCVKEWFLAGLCHFSVLLHTLGGNVSTSPRSNVSRFGKTTARLLRQSGRWANPRQVKAESLCLLLQLSYTFEFFFSKLGSHKKPACRCFPDGCPSVVPRCLLSCRRRGADGLGL